MKALLQRLDKFINGTNGTLLVALLIAIFSFYSIKKLISKEATFWVEIVPEIPASMAGKTFVRSEPGDVEVTLQGSPEQLASVRKEDLKLAARIKEGTEGTNVVLRLERGWIEGNDKARVRKIEPNQATLLFDEEGEVNLTVARPEIVGKPLIGEAELVWSETNIVARGLKTVLRDLQASAAQLTTEPIDVDGRVQGFKRRVRILWPKNITGDVADLEVQVQINFKTEIKKFENQRVLLTILPGSGVSYTSNPERVTVNVTGGEEALEQLDSDHFSVTASCTRIDGEHETIPLQVIFNSGIEGLVGEAVPPKVEITAHYMRKIPQTTADQKPAEIAE